MKLDKMDREILKLLTDNGRASWSDMAEKIGLSKPATAERVRRLEENGVIEGFTARLSAEALGLHLTAFIDVNLERPEHRAPFLERVAELEEVLECHHLAGENDYMLKVVCTGTKHLERLLSHELKSIAGVTRTRTNIVLSSPKEGWWKLPLPQ